MSDEQTLTRHTRTDGGEDYADQDPGQKEGGPGSPCAPARGKQHPSLRFSSPGQQIKKAPECHSHICVGRMDVHDRETQTGPNKDGSVNLSRCLCGTELKIEERDCGRRREEEKEDLR